MAGMAHHYVSTACLHEDQDPALHEACRQSCKYCDASCQCPQHVTGGTYAPVSWVDQARDMARELLRYGLSTGAVMPELLHRIESDPALFWLRGEEQPPGEWHG
jgi:hypothetical protein